MSYFVPDFEMEEEDYPIPTSSGCGFHRPAKSSLPEDEIMELLWHNGQVVLQSQNQKSAKKSGPGFTPMPYNHRYTAVDAMLPTDSCTVSEIRSPQTPEELEHQSQHLFMQEDEMTSWLHYPMVDDPPLDPNFCADLLYPSSTEDNDSRNASTINATAVTTNTVLPVRLSQRTELPQTMGTAAFSGPRPPILPTRRTELAEPRIKNFALFSKHNAKAQVEPSVILLSNSKTVVDSSDTPALAPSSAISEIGKSCGDVGTARVTQSSGGATTTATLAAAATTTSAGGRDTATCEITVSSSPGGSSASAEPRQKPPTEDRKRKSREPEESEAHSEDMEMESLDAKKQVRGSSSTKRSRAAEVHNLSERRRRDRINEKMRALQELIPRCNKSDKASMLDEAIEYLKSLQLQVQMMSMGCGMVPMMFAGMQQFMPSLPAMGMGIGMGMGMEMGMNRPVMPFPNVLNGSPLPAPAVPPHLGPMFSMPPFPMPLVPPHDSSRMQATNQPDHMLTSFVTPDLNQSRIPSFSDPYQQYLGPQQMHLQLMQNQAMIQPSSNKPSSSKDAENTENRESG